MVLKAIVNYPDRVSDTWTFEADNLREGEQFLNDHLESTGNSHISTQLSIVSHGGFYGSQGHA